MVTTQSPDRDQARSTRRDRRRDRDTARETTQVRRVLEVNTNTGLSFAEISIESRRQQREDVEEKVRDCDPGPRRQGGQEGGKEGGQDQGQETLRPLPGGDCGQLS